MNVARHVELAAPASLHIVLGQALTAPWRHAQAVPLQRLVEGLLVGHHFLCFLLSDERGI